MKHTPTPWFPKTLKTTNTVVIKGMDEGFELEIARVRGAVADSEESANAAHIVHCVNTHAGLISVLETLLETPELCMDDMEDFTRTAIQDARNILAAAKKGAAQ